MTYKRRDLEDTRPIHTRKAVRRRRLGGDPRLRVTIVVRPSELPADSEIRAKVQRNEMLLPHERIELSQPEFEEYHSAAEDHIALVLDFARDHELEIVDVSRARHDVVVEGTASALERAFEVRLEEFECEEGSYRAHDGPIRVPEELSEVIEGVIGLDDIPRHRPHAALDGAAPTVLYEPAQIAALYRFPDGARGAGQRIAILSFGGGFDRRDLEAYFGSRGLRVPEMTLTSVLGGDPTPMNYDTLHDAVADLKSGMSPPEIIGKYPDDGAAVFLAIENTMDLQIVGAAANAARIDFYRAPGSADGFRAAIYAALGMAAPGSMRHLDGGDGPRGLPSVISISWGNIERAWTANDMIPIHRALQAAKDKGVTVCCSSGDQGSAGVPPENTGGMAHVNFPASSPCALACGGTSLTADLDCGRILDERVWNSVRHGRHGATGGGISGFFPLPVFQQSVNVPSCRSLGSPVWISPRVKDSTTFCGRGVPDVSGNADPNTGYRILVGGVEMAGGGTSAASPLWAALIACCQERLGVPLGWINPLLYRDDFRPAFQGIVEGDNDISAGKIQSFCAGQGWNPCTGLGTPNGRNLLSALGPRE